MSELSIGIDVGGTKIEGVLINAEGEVLTSLRVPARRGNERVVADVVRVARTLSDTPIPVGIGIPGQVDTATGVVRNIVNLGVGTLPLASEVSSRYGAPVMVYNDVNAASLGAAFVSREEVGGGGLFSDDTVVFLNFGTGLAAGVVYGGRLQRGASGAIGEIGHLPVDPNRFPCPCGQEGCLETVASGSAVARLWPADGYSLPDLLDHARAGNVNAIRVLTMVMHAIGDTLQIVVQSYDPQLILLGGGMAKTGQSFVNVIAAELRRRAAQSEFLKEIDIPSRLRLVPTDVPIGGIGAALAVSQRG